LIAAIRAWRHWPKVAALAAIAVLTLVADRLTRVPTAAAIIEDSTWEVPVGNELLLTGAPPGRLLDLQTGAGDGIALEAGPVRLADGRRAEELSWQVSTPGTTEGDNKVRIQLGKPPQAGDGTLILERAGDEVPPQFLASSPDMDLEVEAGVVFGDELVLPPIHLLVDDKAVDDPGLALAFTLLAGGELLVTVPSKPDGRLSGLLVRIGERERKGNRLRLREAAIRSDGAERPWKVACAAPEGATRWPVAWRSSAVPHGDDCAAAAPSAKAPALLAASDLTIDEKTIKVDLRGSAYVVDTRTPVQARWLEWVKGNIVLSVVFGVLLAALVKWLVGTLRGKSED